MIRKKLVSLILYSLYFSRDLIDLLSNHGLYNLFFLLHEIINACVIDSFLIKIRMFTDLLIFGIEAIPDEADDVKFI